MKPAKLTIEIENKKIKNITPNDFGVEIISNNQSNKFNNCFAMSSFVDSHCHLWGLGMKKLGLDFTHCESQEDCIQKLIENPYSRGGWIVGRGWNQEKWINKILPEKSALDEHFDAVPVCLTRIDGHAIWVNSLALRLAKIDKFSPNPEGGSIIKDKSGEPTGLLIDNAMNLVEKIIPQFNNDELERFILQGISDCISFGITEVHDMDVPFNQIPIYRKLNDANKLKINISSYLAAQNDEYERLNLLPESKKNLNILGVKFYADGALGSRGAALRFNYNDSNHNGLLMIKEDTLFNKSEKAINLGFQIATHAIGDLANYTVLQTYKNIRDSYPEAILRIEHAQIIQPNDLDLFLENSIIPSVQSIHFVSDIKMAPIRLGEKRFVHNGYPWKAFIERGIELIAGSDFPIESPNPFLGIDAFINRNKYFNYSELKSISLEDALKSYTLNPRKVTNTSNRTLEVGNIADFIIIDNNFDDNNTIKESKVISTYIDGEKVL